MSDGAVQQREKLHHSGMVIWGNVIATGTLLLMFAVFLFGSYKDDQKEKQQLASRVTVVEVTVAEQRRVADERYQSLTTMMRDANAKLDKLIARMLDKGEAGG